MTCIAWDGVTLAADKRGTFAGLARTVTKIFRVGERLVAVAGNCAEGMDMLDWIRGGRVAADFPPAQRDEKTWATVVLISHDGVELYERTPSPIKIEDRYFATGAGRDYALAAMHLGKSAREGVEVACHFDVSCGNGIDTLTLEERPDATPVPS